MSFFRCKQARPAQYIISVKPTLRSVAVFWTTSHFPTSLCTASNVSCKRGTTRICCCSPVLQPRAAAEPVVRQSIDISFPPGAQQQTRRALLQRANKTHRRTDTVPLRRPCSAGSANNGPYGACLYRCSDVVNGIDDMDDGGATIRRVVRAKSARTRAERSSRRTVAKRSRRGLIECCSVFYFLTILSDQLSERLPHGLRRICRDGRTIAVDERSEVSFTQLYFTTKW